MDVVSYVLGYQGGLKKGSGQGAELPELDNPAGAAQIREGYEAIDANGAKIEGEMPTVEMYIDSLSFDKTNGKIIAGATVTGSGYVQQIRKTQNASVSTLGATTIIPGAEDQVIEKHRWLTGDITVKAASLDLPDLENPAAAADIRAGREVVDENGEVVVGTMPDSVVEVGEPYYDNETGMICASVAYTEGYVKGGGTLAMSSKSVTIEPNKYNSGIGDQVIPGGGWLEDDIKLQAKTVAPGEAAIEVTPDEGYLGLSKVIVEAVTSGGGGGGGGNIKIATGTHTGAYTTGEIITHNLGCIPDIFIIHEKSGGTSGATHLISAWGFSKALVDKFEIPVPEGYVAHKPSASPYYTSTYYGKSNAGEHGIELNYNGIGKATETTVSIANSLFQCLTRKDASYFWIAIGGLT